MPRKKIAHTEPEEEVLTEEVEELGGNRRSGGLDLYDADGELLEEGEPTYIEEDEEEEN